jgi:thioredoxin-like negative regulator of GroEL
VATLGGFLKFFANVLYGGLPDASVKESIIYLKRAVEADPSNLEHHLELGKSYLEADDEEDAKKEFQAVMILPQQEAYDKDLKKEAGELLNDLE